MRIVFFVVLGILALAARPATSADAERVNRRIAESVQSNDLVAVTLADGTVLQGRITNETAETITVVTGGGIEATIPRTSVVGIELVRGRVVEGRFRRFDPNYSRLLYAPTGRPLKSGDGYFADHYVFFPSLGVGIGDHFTLMGGMSMIPGIGFGDQMYFVAPKLGFQPNDHSAFAVGTLFVRVAGESAGIAYGVSTFGEQDRSLTAGLGFPYSGSEGFADGWILMLGGNVRLSNSAALVSENWIVFAEGETHGFYTIAVRLFGERLAADFGFILFKEVLEEGFPIPWLSIAYNFGR